MRVKDSSSRIRLNEPNRFRQAEQTTEEWRSMLRHFRDLLAALPLTALTATLFIGGSYLFFVQLAEYGW